MITVGSHGRGGPPQLSSTGSSRADSRADELRSASLGSGSSAQPVRPVCDPQAVLDQLSQEARGQASACPSDSEQLFAVFVNGQTVTPYRDDGPPGGIFAVSSAGGFYRLFRVPFFDELHGQENQVYYRAPVVDRGALHLTAREIGDARGRGLDRLVPVASFQDRDSLELAQRDLKKIELVTGLLKRATLISIGFGVVVFGDANCLLLGAGGAFYWYRATVLRTKLLFNLNSQGLFLSAEDNFAAETTLSAAQSPHHPQSIAAPTERARK